MKTIGELRQFLRGEENQTLTNCKCHTDHICGGELCIVCGYREKIKPREHTRGEKVELEQKLAEAEEKIKDARNSMGKVEAYEKLLMGRSLQISK